MKLFLKWTGRERLKMLVLQLIQELSFMINVKANMFFQEVSYEKNSSFSSINLVLTLLHFLHSRLLLMGSRDDDMVTGGCRVKAGYFAEQVTSDSCGICGATGWGDGCGKLSESLINSRSSQWGRSLTDKRGWEL